MRQIDWLLTLSNQERDAKRKSYVIALAEVWPEARELEALAREFVRLFRERDGQGFNRWIEAAKQTPLRAFARWHPCGHRAVRA